MPRRSLKELLATRLHLAPIAGITNLPFRIFMRELGAELVVSELISSEGYAHGSRITKRMMLVHEAEQPIGLQIFGARPEAMADAARFCEDCGADFVDLNMGCPVPKVVSSGGGSALLRDLPHAGRVMAAVRRAVSIPLSVKIRSGWDCDSVNALETAMVAAGSGVDWLTLHARTTAQGYSGKADWELIRRLHECSKIPVIGNGDILSAAEAVNKLKNNCCSAVMIGRAALGNPYIFLQSLELLSGNKQLMPAPEKMLSRLRELMLEHSDIQEAATRLKKLSVWFSSGMSGKALFRQQMFALGGNPDEILELAIGFLTRERFAAKKACLPSANP